MKDLLEYIVKGIVEKPSDVQISEAQESGEEVFTLEVAPEDMGKIIGKNGQIIKAIRTLLRTAALKDEKKVRLILAESPKS